METRRNKVKRKLQDLRAGKEPTVTPADLLSQEIGEVPLPEERAVLRLSSCIEASKDPDYCVVSWASQVEAMEYFNNNGLGATLSRIVELGGSLD
jgi:hypothetical protein